MGFGEAVKTVSGKYASFEGRASRSEFWWWYLFLVIVQIIAAIIDNVTGLKINYNASGAFSANISNVGWIGVIVGLALLIPTIAVTVRRLHDTDKSGWWWWLNVICCVGGIVIFIFMLIPSTPGPNRFGPQPGTGGPGI